METQVLTVETAAQFERAVEEAVGLLRAGEVVALPTETVYGLAANAFVPKAVSKIYEVKGRPAHNPLILHVSSLAMARRCVTQWPAEAELLARHFWPGPLTIVLPRAPQVPDIVAAGGTTVAIRWPLHPLMRTVIERCDFPLAAPSANLSNQVSPTMAEHVVGGLGGRIPLVVDAGPTSVGIESTVLDLTCAPLAVLRPGMISAEQISKVLGRAVIRPSAHSGADLKSPGQLAKHYSPRAQLRLRNWNNDAELFALARETGVAPGAIHVIAHDCIPQANPFGRVAVIPHDPEAYARALYAELHRSDSLGAELILVEAPPESAEWDGVRDRLTRASA